MEQLTDIEKELYGQKILIENLGFEFEKKMAFKLTKEEIKIIEIYNKNMSKHNFLIN